MDPTREIRSAKAPFVFLHVFVPRPLPEGGKALECSPDNEIEREPDREHAERIETHSHVNISEKPRTPTNLPPRPGGEEVIAVCVCPAPFPKSS